MSQSGRRLRPLSGSALGLLLLAPVGLFTMASLLKYTITTMTLRPRLLTLAVATLSLVLLALLAGYAVAENLGHS